MAKDVASDEIVWILRQFVRGERAGQLLDLRRADEQQQHAADHLQHAVGCLEQDADLERTIQRR